MYGELNLGAECIGRNPITGRFVKGMKPHNKGKKLSEYYGDKWEDIRAKMVESGKKNKNKEQLSKFLKAGQDAQKRKVIGINMQTGKMSVFDSITDAAKGYDRVCAKTHIGRCCRQAKIKQYSPNGKYYYVREYQYKGVKWFYESDIERWSDYLKSINERDKNKSE